MRLKLQADQTKGLEGHVLKITGRKQAQTMNKIFEGIYRRGENTTINLIKGQRSNRTGFQEIRGRARITCYRE